MNKPIKKDHTVPGWKKINKAIDRYHFLLDSYSKLMEACADTTASHEKWLTKLTISSWLTHVKEVLNCGCLVAQCVAQVQGSGSLDMDSIGSWKPINSLSMGSGTHQF